VKFAIGAMIKDAIEDPSESFSFASATLCDEPPSHSEQDYYPGGH